MHYHAGIHAIMYLSSVITSKRGFCCGGCWQEFHAFVWLYEKTLHICIFWNEKYTCNYNVPFICVYFKTRLLLWWLLARIPRFCMIIWKNPSYLYILKWQIEVIYGKFYTVCGMGLISVGSLQVTNYEGFLVMGTTGGGVVCNGLTGKWSNS